MEAGMGEETMSTRRTIHLCPYCHCNNEKLQLCQTVLLNAEGENLFQDCYYFPYHIVGATYYVCAMILEDRKTPTKHAIA